MLAFALHSATYTHGKTSVSGHVHKQARTRLHPLDPLIGFMKTKAGRVGSERLVGDFHAPL